MLVKGNNGSLNEDTVKKYLCPEAGDREIFLFLELCRVNELNPFTGDAFLIKFRDKVQMIVSKSAFLKRAEQHPAFKGFRAGIIVESGGEIKYREGSFYHSKEHLLGGWAEVYREDRPHPIKAEVALHEYNLHNNVWNRMPATMIRKIAIVQALREAFPLSLSGCYIAEEVNTADPVEVESIEETEISSGTVEASGDGANPEGVEAGGNTDNPKEVSGNGNPEEEAGNAEPEKDVQTLEELLEEVKSINVIEELKNWWFHHKQAVEKLPEEEQKRLIEEIKNKKNSLIGGEHV